MYWTEFERGYQEVIAVIEEIIDDYLDENNRKLKMMSEMLWTDMPSFEKLLDETTDTTFYLSGMYKVKNILICSMEVALDQTNNQDFKAGRQAALNFIETVIKRSKKGLYELDETKKEECIKRIFGAEYLYNHVKQSLPEIYEED